LKKGAEPQIATENTRIKGQDVQTLSLVPSGFSCFGTAAAGLPPKKFLMSAGIFAVAENR
jgi:hypothetical protein